TAEELEKNAAELATVTPALIHTVNSIMSAGQAVKAKANISKPAGQATRQPGTKQQDDGPVCDCGEPYNDVRDKTYQKGPKKGQSYPYSYYPSCKNRDCKPIE